MILDVMEHDYQVKRTCLQWIKLHLNERKFKICIKNQYSNQKELSFSVLQGSRGGPDFFVWYSSTLQELIPDDTPIYAYADDHNFSKPLYQTAVGKMRKTVS